MKNILKEYKGKLIRIYYSVSGHEEWLHCIVIKVKEEDNVLHVNTNKKDVYLPLDKVFVVADNSDHDFSSHIKESAFT